MALYYVEKRSDGFELCVWEITETEAQLCDMCAMPKDEWEELQKKGSEKRRKEQLAIKVLIQTMLDKSVSVEHDKDGRPFLKNHTKFLSISHTRRFAVACIHPYKKVGVDIESLERNFSAVEMKALSSREQEYLSNELRSLQLAILWSAKEAIYKYFSMNGVDFSRQISIEKFKPAPHGALHACFEKENNAKTKMVVYYKTIDDHILTWIVK